MWLQDFEQLPNVEQERFRKVTNYILNKTYILREIFEHKDRIGKINADYRFLERNFPLFEGYLQYAGYRLNKDDNYGIIYITNDYDFNVVRLDKLTTLMLLSLRSLFDDGKSNDSGRNVVFVTSGELILKMIEDKILIKKPTNKDIIDSLRILIRHNIINKLDGNIEDSNCVLTIYPTITKLVSNDKITALYQILFNEIEEGENA